MTGPLLVHHLPAAAVPAAERLGWRRVTDGNPGTRRVFMARPIGRGDSAAGLLEETRGLLGEEEAGWPVPLTEAEVAYACGVAAQRGDAAADNPFPEDSHGGRVWRLAFLAAGVKHPSAVASHVKHARRSDAERVGKGHAREGDRGEWPAADLQLLHYTRALPAAVAAALLGRSVQAVKSQRCRQAKLMKGGGQDG